MKRWRRWFSRNKEWEQDMQDELRYHIERQIAANISAGLAPDEARRQAVLQLGALEGVKEDCREQRSGFWLESLYADVRYALRILRKSPGFTTIAILTLALGIGANTAIFAVLDPLLLRKLPVPHPDELIWINSSGTFGRPAEGSEVETYYAYRDQGSAFTSVLAFSGIAPYELTYKGRKISAKGELVSANYFAALGVRPFAGHLLADSDQHGPPGLVVSFAFWKRELDSSQDAIGKAIAFGDQSTPRAPGRFRSTLSR